MKIYTIIHTCQDYDYPDSRLVNIRCSCKTIEDARKELAAEVRESFDANEWDTDEEYEEFIRNNFRSEDYWVDEREYGYVEINIVENELKD